MHHLVLVSSLLSLMLCVPSLVRAALLTGHLVSPVKAVISPRGADITVEEEVMVTERNGVSTIAIFVPSKAEDIRIKTRGATLLQEEYERAVLTPTSRNALLAQELTSRRNAVQAQKKIVEERKKLWETIPERIAAADFSGLDAQKKALFTELLAEEHRLVQEEKNLTAMLNDLPRPKHFGICVVGTVVGATTKTIPVTYTYHLPDCSWTARYIFSIDPELVKDHIDVRLVADIRQESGIDWTNTAVTLVTGTRGKRVPPNLASWILEEKRPEERRHEEKSLMAARKYRDSAMMLDNASNEVSVGAMAPQAPQVDTSGVYAKWLLPATSIAEGRSTVTMLEQQWHDPVQWIARPSRTRGEVYLKAEHTVDKGTVWPDGQAIYRVSGQTTGSGRFQVSGERMTLFFGMDPRVSFDVIQDDRKQGEKGFLDREKTWTWSWSYVVTNTHAQPIRVRVERPEPRAVQEKIVVSHSDTPTAQRDPEHHSLFWNLDVPAGGKERISHSVTIRAPENLAVTPVAP